MATKTSSSNFSRIDFLILFVILITALFLRLYKLDNPVADWHSWRQADTAAVGRNFVRGGFDLMHPKYDDLGSNQTGHDNPQGLRMVEFPIYNAIFAFLYKTLPLISIEMYGRLTSSIFSLLIIVVLYLLALYEENRIAAIFSALIFAVMPFFVFYSREILPEMTATSFAFLGIFFLHLWSRKKWSNLSEHGLFLVSAIFTALALLTKPTTIFYLLPLVYLLFKKWGFGSVKKIRTYLYFIIGLVPLVLWRYWIQQFPEGIPASQWLITSVNTWEGQKNIFFRPAFFRWIFYERIPNLIFGGYLIVFFVLGLIKKPKRSFIILSIFAGAFSYLFTFQGGNVQHDYYQTLILPALALISGVGISFLFEEKKQFLYIAVNTILMVVILVFSFAFSYYKVKDYYWTDPDLLSISKIVNTVTPQNSKLVTDRDGDTTLLYLSDRKGYAAVTEDLSGLKNRGMQYFVTLHKEVADNVKKEKKYQLIFESEKVFIFKL